MPLTMRGRLSRRGVFLMMFGTMYGVIGGVTLAGPAVIRFLHLPATLSTILNSDLWGLLWILCGLVAAVAGIRTVGYRPGEVHDGWGFTALLLAPGAWTVFYVVSLVAFLAGGGRHRSPAAVVTFVIGWCLVWLIVLGAAYARRGGGGGIRGFARTSFARVLSTVIAAGFLVTLIVFLLTGRDSVTGSTIGVAVWSLAWSTVLLLSGWPDPPSTPRQTPRHGDR
jgi:hypothetical protein